MGEESYIISVKPDGCTILAEDTEGIRRAIVYLEDEMVSKEGPILPLGDIKRYPVLKKRITRGFFSPTNRPPKFGDELLDDVDYYPDEYLNRLAHNGTNGLWIYTSFAQLTASPRIKEHGKFGEERMEKLKRVVRKCRRYGVKVYVFAIEPLGFTPDIAPSYPEFLGTHKGDRYVPICLRTEAGREHTVHATEKIFREIPELGGFIDITAGERPTSCASVATFCDCPRCKKYSRGENLAYAVDVLKEGIRRSGAKADFISWTYGHRYWNDNDIVDYISENYRNKLILKDVAGALGYDYYYFSKLFHQAFGNGINAIGI